MKITKEKVEKNSGKLQKKKLRKIHEKYDKK